MSIFNNKQISVEVIISYTQKVNMLNIIFYNIEETLHERSKRWANYKEIYCKCFLAKFWVQIDKHPLTRRFQ